MIAYRYVAPENQEGLAIGVQLTPSYRWIGDEQTTERLAGTCAFASLAQCLEYAQWSTGLIVEISGRRVHNSRRNRRVQGEVVLADAVITKIIAERPDRTNPWRI